MKKYIFMLSIAFTILLNSCNSEGSGIFFQISQEVPQITSELSELSVHQVVEAGGELYARTGGKIWIKTGSGRWSDINKDNFIYNIVEYSTELYGTLLSEINTMSDGKISKYNGTSWIDLVTYNTNLSMFEANGTYILVKGVSGVDAIASSTDPSSLPDNEIITSQVFDGASHTANSVNILISKDELFTGIIDDIESYIYNFTEPKNGDFTGISVSSGNDFYLTTSSGQIYISTNNGVDWTWVGTITEDILRSGSLDIVTVDGGTTYYLIIGTHDGFYEMEIGTTTITATSAEPDFATAYPELSTALIYEVYQSAAGFTGEYFYLATSNGLWKGNADGTFTKQ